MNKVLLIGRLTKDPDVRYTQGENPTTIARFTLAVDRKYKKQGEQGADFLPCIAFGKSAEFAEKYFRQGMKVAAEGRIQTGSYTNHKGDKVYTMDIVIESLEFCEKKSEQPSGDVNGNNYYAAGGSSHYDTEAGADYGFLPLPYGEQEQLPFSVS